jgi:hypothetical protein
LFALKKKGLESRKQFLPRWAKFEIVTLNHQNAGGPATEHAE